MVISFFLSRRSITFRTYIGPCSWALTILFKRDGKLTKFNAVVGSSSIYNYFKNVCASGT